MSWFPSGTRGDRPVLRSDEPPSSSRGSERGDGGGSSLEPNQHASDAWQPDSGGESRVQGHSDGWAALADASWSNVSSAVGGGGGGGGGEGAGMTEVVPPAPSSPAPSSTEAVGPGREGDGPPPLEPIEPAGVDDVADGHEVEGDPRGESDQVGLAGGGGGSTRTSFLHMVWRSKWRLAATWGEGFLILTTLSLLLLLVMLHQTFIGGTRCLGDRPAMLARGKQDLIEITIEGRLSRMSKQLRVDLMRTIDSKKGGRARRAARNANVSSYSGTMLAWHLLDLVDALEGEIAKLLGLKLPSSMPMPDIEAGGETQGKKGWKPFSWLRKNKGRDGREGKKDGRQGGGGGGEALTLWDIGISELSEVDAMVMIIGLEELEALLTQPSYLYSREKGFLILSHRTLSSMPVKRTNLTLRSDDECFGRGFLGWMLEYWLGYDTIILNELHAIYGRGYVHTVHTSDLYNINLPMPSQQMRDHVTAKIGVLITSAFLVMTTSTLVAFTLRETHMRILRFTVQLRYYNRNRVPYVGTLLASHFIESLAFVPIMIGVLMFLFEFFDDQMLAFMVFTVVWVSEIFCMVRVRGNAGMRKFPNFFLSLFLAYLIYIYSYPLGFSYLAFTCWLSSVASTMVYFSNRFHPRTEGNQGVMGYDRVVHIAATTTVFS